MSLNHQYLVEVGPGSPAQPGPVDSSSSGLPRWRLSGQSLGGRLGGRHGGGPPDGLAAWRWRYCPSRSERCGSHR
ncbi:hypothetical protein TW86_13330 [Halomonas sp. S2151]|nr:hypothetical protein TW86_13330 [Halomonas sp. S2151]